ncbi:MAG: thioredoxin domain-containing protein [Solirubrobacterales bacterium]
MANRLAEETSPYLLQHKDNPVDWYPWGEEALQRAQSEDRPILLSVGYSACHWCHVMERESFEDPEVAALMNENFVPIKVDREERPDVDDLYMEAVQAMIGQGGWPLTAFLDPEGVPFHGGTYFPPEPRQGLPSFRQVMEAVLDAYRNRRDEIDEASGKVREGLGAIGKLQPTEDELTLPLLEHATSALLARADYQKGGFGGAPKFPPASALEYLLARGAEAEGHDRRDLLAHVERTLDAMAFGGIYDQLGGGFARYSVDPDWLVPHFEKMLYDNALLARCYLHAFQALGHERYRRICCETLDWALREMRGPEGGFCSALDADSEGEEGRYYVWEEGEVREVLTAAGLDEGAIERALGYWGISPAGNFEGRNILHVPAGASADPPAELDDARAALLERREQRVRPGLDDKRICSWNALMISALAEAGAVLGRDDYLEAARSCADFVLGTLRDGEGRLLRTYKDGEARILAYLEDHAFLLEALLALYEASFEQPPFKAARETAEAMVERFADPEQGGFFTTASDAEQLIARRKDLADHPIPSGNSSAAVGLLRLAELSGEHDYAARADGVLRLLTPTAVRHPEGFGHLLLALDFQLSPVREVALAGNQLGELAAAVRKRHRPRVVLAGGPEGTTEPPLMRDRKTVDGHPAAYVCENFACKQPVTGPAELAIALGDSGDVGSGE